MGFQNRQYRVNLRRPIVEPMLQPELITEYRKAPPIITPTNITGLMNRYCVGSIERAGSHSKLYSRHFLAQPSSCSRQTLIFSENETIILVSAVRRVLQLSHVTRHSTRPKEAALYM